MKLQLGTVGHLGIAVRDPQKSAKWWVENLNLKKRFAFPGGVVIGSDGVDLVLHKGKPQPDVLDHVSFHLPSRRALKSALKELKAKNVRLEDPGDEIGPEGPGSRNMGLWFYDPDGYRWELSVLAKSVKRRRTRKRKTAA